jgi:hypothetical protein
MVAVTLQREAPIYEDVLIERIARAHGFQRSGDRIQKANSKIVGRKYRKTQDDGRSIIWPENSAETGLVSYPRESGRGQVAYRHPGGRTCESCIAVRSRSSLETQSPLPVSEAFPQEPATFLRASRCCGAFGSHRHFSTTVLTTSLDRRSKAHLKPRPCTCHAVLMVAAAITSPDCSECIEIKYFHSHQTFLHIP